MGKKKLKLHQLEVAVVGVQEQYARGLIHLLFTVNLWVGISRFWPLPAYGVYNEIHFQGVMMPEYLNLWNIFNWNKG